MSISVPTATRSGVTPRRSLATRDAAWSIAIARSLAHRGMTPNVVSMLSVVFAIAAGAALAASPSPVLVPRAVTLLIAAGCVQLRLLCNLLDGMLAVEEGLKTPTGELFNELPDRIADVVILVGAGYAVRDEPYGLVLGWSAAVAAMFTAYVRVLGGSLGVTQHFIGPMAKQHRMFTVTLAAIIAAGETLLGLRARAMVWALAVITVGSLITIVRRTNRIAAELGR
jgi:phosphatidylglycerophosphate synthase